MPKRAETYAYPTDSKKLPQEVRDMVASFNKECVPLEKKCLYLLTDARTGAIYCECHLRASTIVSFSTIDVPLDPDDQPEYRANREIVDDHAAFKAMREDACGGRTFSNLVAEYATDRDSEHPIKIIGGQHRFKAIEEALSEGVDEYHGLKMYFGLNSEQRLDVQLISNTNIAVSSDLLDRMLETVSGPQLRDWCQQVGLLEEEEDFSDKRQLGKSLTVRAARMFITNFFLGQKIPPKQFNSRSTIPTRLRSGTVVKEWEDLKSKKPNLWKDKGLEEAGREFAGLVATQRAYFSKNGGSQKDFSEKALHYAVLPAWAYVAGVLQENRSRLKNHYKLQKQKGKDPLNAAALANGRHRSDPENYRGLGYRSEVKEMGRCAELFFAQAEKGKGITKQLVDVAIKRYHTKVAMIELREAEAKVK